MLKSDTFNCAIMVPFYVLKLNWSGNSKNGNAIESIFELHYYYAN